MQVLSSVPKTVALEFQHMPDGVLGRLTDVEIVRFPSQTIDKVYSDLNKPLVLDVPLSDILPDMAGQFKGKRDEFSHARFTRVTTVGEEFAASNDYVLRPTMFRRPRPVRLLISIRLSNPGDIISVFRRLPAVLDTLDKDSTESGLSSGERPFGENEWKHRVVHVHCPLFPEKELARTLHDLGVRPLIDRENEWAMCWTGSMTDKYLKWHIYEV
jgi:hypothetical protein